MECQICMEIKPGDNVSCGSTVPHNLCFECENTWRNKMPVQGGIRIMNCPTCRQPEKYRTIESLQRERSSLQRERSSLQRERSFVQVSELVAAISAIPTAAISTEAQILSSIVRASRDAQRAAPTLQLRAPTEHHPTEHHPRSRCVSGRNCRSTSRTGRAMTHLKCTICRAVFCCRNCKDCIGCRPSEPLRL